MALRNFHSMTDACTLAAQMGPKVGVLCREGKPMFYVYSPDGHLYERHRAEDMQDLLRMWAAAKQ